MLEHEHFIHTARCVCYGETVLSHALAFRKSSHSGDRLQSAELARRQSGEYQRYTCEQSDRQNHCRRAERNVKAEARLQSQHIDQRGKQHVGTSSANCREKQRCHRIGQYNSPDNAARCKAQRFEHAHLRHFFCDGGFDAELTEENAHEQHDDCESREYHREQISHHHAGLLLCLACQRKKNRGLMFLSGFAEIGKHCLNVLPFHGTHRVVDHLAARKFLR